MLQTSDAGSPGMPPADADGMTARTVFSWRLVASLGSMVAFACTGAPVGPEEATGTTSAALTGQSIATIALANVGKGACSTNSQAGTAFDSSCTGNGGQPEYWCADFARWVWAQAGASNTSELTAAAGSFYVYGQNHATLHSSPAVGDAAVFNYQGGGVADHVAVVTQVNSNGTIETVSGDWNGQSGSEAQFSSTSHVVLNSPAYPDGQGTTPGIMGMTISGYIGAVGVDNTAPYGAAFVSQTFPLASTALTMFAGQTLPASITLKNIGSKTWDSSTHLGTTQPRDRTSVFADGSWLGPDRPAGVSGTVAPGATFAFAFNFHAPSKVGTYLEYFDLVQEGVAWFSDPGQGGPPDDDLEAQIVVVAGVRGHLDGADCTAIAGWSQDQANPADGIFVDLYFDAPASPSNTAAMRVTANVSRSDLCTAINSCDHGFSVPPPAALCDGNAHKVYAYGIASSGDGPNELLGGAPLSFTCAAPPTPPGSDDAGTDAEESDASSSPPPVVLDAAVPTNPRENAPSGAAPSKPRPAAAAGGGCSVTSGSTSEARGAWMLMMGFAVSLARRSRSRRRAARQ
jgi:MYXO-CTERM domain-containing protein